MILFCHSHRPILWCCYGNRFGQLTWVPDGTIKSGGNRNSTFKTIFRKGFDLLIKLLNVILIRLDSVQNILNPNLNYVGLLTKKMKLMLTYLWGIDEKTAPESVNLIQQMPCFFQLNKMFYLILLTLFPL